MAEAWILFLLVTEPGRWGVAYAPQQFPTEESCAAAGEAAGKALGLKGAGLYTFAYWKCVKRPADDKRPG